ncbi:uncharacterized protein, partial [Littorina saxatilis]|uniref:uncharacterized protein n=1 Tax=Littorina saxatilis TaxID=31220 RepID=UPI0038B5630C
MADPRDSWEVPAWVRKFDSLDMQQLGFPRAVLGPNQRYAEEVTGVYNPTYQTGFKPALRQPAFSRDQSFHQQPLSKPGSEVSKALPCNKASSTCKRVFVVVAMVIVVLLLIGTIAAVVSFTVLRPDSEPLKNVVFGMEAALNETFDSNYNVINNTASIAFIKSFCDNISVPMKKYDGQYKGCTVNKLTNGSILVSFQLFFTEIQESPSTDKMKTFLISQSGGENEGQISVQGMVIITSRIKVTEVKLEVKVEDFKPDHTVAPSFTSSTTEATTTTTGTATTETTAATS